MQCFPNGVPRNSGCPRSENFGFAQKRNYNLNCYVIITHDGSLLELLKIQIKYNQFIILFSTTCFGLKGHHHVEHKSKGNIYIYI